MYIQTFPWNSSVLLFAFKAASFLNFKRGLLKASRSRTYIPPWEKANFWDIPLGVVLSKGVYTLCLLSLWYTLVWRSRFLYYVDMMLLRDLCLLHITGLNGCRFSERFFELADRAGITDRVWARSVPPEEFLACESHGLINLRVL